MRQEERPPPIDYYYRTLPEEKESKRTPNVLVALTESVTHNIVRWASQYHSSTTQVIRTAVNFGYHKKEVWYNILFQLAIALCVMQIKNIAINNFSMRDNVFIKDIKYDGQKTKHWRYKLDDFTYYIPNYGYVLMIDTKFKKPGNDQYMVYGDIFEGNNLNNSNEDIQKMVFNSFVEAFDPNIFKADKIIEPDSEIRNFMNKVHQSALNEELGTNISDYIKEHFKIFLNNRIGTVLSSSENAYVRSDLPLSPKPGKVFARLIQNGKYDFILFHKLIDGQRAKIFSKNKKGEMIEQQARLDELSTYEEEIAQKFKSGGPNVRKDGMREIYNIKT
jgi:hypothetical protein